MATVRQLPTPVNVEVVAGDPFTVTFTATTGVTTFASAAVAMTTAGGDAYTTDPGIPTASAASAVLTCSWSAADTAALNTATRSRSYKYSVEATADGDGPFQIFAGTITVHPVGSSGVGTSSATTASLTLGGAAVTAVVALGASGGGGASVTVSDTAPSGATAGDLWYDSTTGLLYIYFDSFWVGTGGGGGSGGGGASALDDLTDVTITAAASGDILRHNGSAWVDAVGTTHFDAAGSAATAQAAAQAAAEATAAAALSAHTGDTSDAHDASAISFTPTGTIASFDVQAAIAEVATDAAAAVGSANAGSLLYLYANFT